jgi:hypothetical protein
MGLDVSLNQANDLAAESHNPALTRLGLGQRFLERLQILCRKGRKVVLLINKYDKPLVDGTEDHTPGHFHFWFFGNAQ